MMNEGALHELPEGWVWTMLGEIVNVTSGYGFPKKYQGRASGEIPFFKVMDISRSVLNGSRFLKVANNYISKKDCEEIRANPLRKRTIVFAKIGEAIKLNRRAILQQDSLVDNNVMGIYPYNETLDNLFAFFFLSTIKLGDYSRATTVPSVRKSDVEQILISLPPLPEQRAIVSKLEQLFSDLDNGIDNFKKAQAQLKLYRQSVLKNACEGKLVPTEAELARVEGRDYEPADVLLARILRERREKWNGKGKYKEAEAPDTDRLPELSNGWCYTHIRALLSTETTGIKTGPFGSLLKKHEHRTEGIPVFGIENIEAMKFIAGSKIHITKEKSTQLSGYGAFANDVLISRSGTVGEVCAVPEGLGEARISTNLMRVTLAPNGMMPVFFTFLFNGSPYVLDQVTDLCKGSTRNFLNQDILFSLIFPLPPLAEQRRIVTEVERRLSICDKMEATITESLQKAESLRQSILKKAFEGKLLNETELEQARSAPDWEPAEKLLERIKAEKTNTQTNNKGKK